MIVCTDSHALPMEVLDHRLFQDAEGKRYRDRVLMLQTGYGTPEERWQQFYRDVRDSSWPDHCSIRDFAQLPLRVRQEIKELHAQDLMWISDDLQSLHMENLAMECADLEHQEKSARYFCKIDRQVINSQVRSMRMTYATEKNFALKIMTAWNDALHDVCAANDFWDYTLWLPLQDMDASMAELERCRDRKFFGVWLDERLPWGWLQQPRPVFEFCSKYRIPIYLHLSGLDDPPLSWEWDYDHPRFVAQKRLWGMDLLLNTNLRWMSSIGSMITEGLLDQFADLRIIVTEKGLSWMMQFRQQMLANAWPDPLPYFKKNFWFTTEPEEPNFIEKANRLGWDRLLFATDYCHKDEGGQHRFKDADLVRSWLESGAISQQHFDLLTHKNYQHLITR